MTTTTALSMSARYLAALPQDHTIATRAELWLAGSLRATFAIDPSSNVQVARSNPIRRTCSVVLTEGVAVDPFGVNVPVVPTAASSLFSPFGSELILYRGITYPNGDVELIQQGVFGIETVEINDTGGDLVITVSGSDRARAVQRSGFADVYVVPPGTLITSAIQALISSTGLTFTFSFIPSPLTTGNTATVFQPGDDPWAKATEMATSIGAELYFDRAGVCTCLPVPDPTVQSIAWRYDEGAVNIAEAVDRTVSRVNAPNYFIRDGQGTGIGVPVRGIDQDLDPTSPTWVNGTYGRVVDYATSALYTSVAQCQVAAQAARRVAQGTEEAATISAVPKPDHEVDDVIEVTRARTGLTAATYVVDSFTMPLSPSGVLAMTCRSVRIGTGFAPAPPIPTAPPLPPLLLTQGATTQTTVVVSWSSPDGTSWAPFLDGIAQPVVLTPTATFSGMAAGSTHIVTVDAISSGGQSLPSAPLSVTTSSATGTHPPNPVTALVQTGTATINSCVLGWTASAVDGTHDAALAYTVAGGGTAVVSGTTASVTGLTSGPSGTSYVFTVTAHNNGGPSTGNPTVTVTTAPTGTGGGVPNPPAGAFSCNFPADFTLNPAGDYGQMMQDAVAKCQASGKVGVVHVADGTYTIKSQTGLGVQSNPPDPSLPIWWIGTSKDRTKAVFTADNSTFDMVSNHINGSQFQYLTFKGTGIDRGPKTLQAGHAFSSGTHNVGVWACTISNQSQINFAGRFTPDMTLVHETPRAIVGYMTHNTMSDVILTSPTAGSNATADFDFQSGLLLENINHIGNRLDFYCVSGIFRNSHFTPMPGGGSNPGFILSTGWDTNTQKGIGPFLVQNFTSSGHGGTLYPAPPVGSKGYVAGRCNDSVTVDNTTMTDLTQGMEIGDVTNFKMVNSTIGIINVNPATVGAFGTIDGSNTYVKYNGGGALDHLTLGGSAAPSAPTGLAASNVTSTSITWSWNSSSGATTYTPRENGVPLSSQAGTSITRTSLTANTPYTFDVSATGAGGTSHYCTAVVQSTSVVVASGWARAYETGYTETTMSGSARVTPGTVNTSIGDLIVIGIQLTDSINTSVSAVSDLAGNTWAAVEAPGSGTQHVSQAMYWTKATHANASNTFSVTPAVTCTVVFDVVAWTGGNALDVHTSSAGSGTTASSGTTAATANASELIVSVEGNNAKGPASAQAFSPQTTLNVETDRVSMVSGAHAHVVISWQISTSTGTQSFSCSDLNATNDCSIAAFTPAGGLTATVPPVPTGLAASGITQNSLDLTWADSGSGTGTPTSYPVYKGSPPVLLHTVTAPTLTYHVSGLSPSTTYPFQVSALNAAGESAKTSAINPTTSASSGTSSLTTVVVIYFENHARSKVFGTAAYLTALANKYSQATNFSTNVHPSLPNYMRFLAGTDGGLTADTNNFLLPVGTKSLIDLIEAKGLTWGSFNEDLAGAPVPPGDPNNLQSPFTQSGSHTNGYYDNHHCPMAHMDNIFNNPTRAKLVVDDTVGTFGGVTGTVASPLVWRLAAAGTLPNFTYWCPNALHDMHQALPGTNSIALGDAWAAKNIAMLLNSPQFAGGQKAVVMVLFDEDTGASMYTCFAGPSAKLATVSAAAYNHYNALRTIEDGLLGAGHATLTANDAGASPMSDMLI